MIDLKDLRENPEKYRRGAELKGITVDVDALLVPTTPLRVYCDVSLKAFDEVVPAAGSAHSAMRIDPLRMAELAGAQWVDVCQSAGPAP